MSDETRIDLSKVIADGVAMLKRQKSPEEQITYFEGLCEESAAKYVALLAKSWKQLLRIAKENGAKDSDAKDAIKFGFSTGVDFSNMGVLKTEYSFTFTENFTTKDGAMRDLAPQDGYGQGGPRADDDLHFPPPDAAPKKKAPATKRATRKRSASK